MNIRNCIIVLIASICIAGCCKSERESWKECDKSIHPDFKAGDFFSERMGDVIMQNGESCYIEEVRKVYSNCHDYNGVHHMYDGKHQCKYCEIYTEPVARRVVCKSGITTNSITYEGSKSRREVIE